MFTPKIEEKTDTECERLFRQVEAVLDRGLALAKLELANCDVLDFCNRSGFEKSGFPYYVWDVTLHEDNITDGYIARKAIIVRYMEPLTRDEKRTVQINTVAERFIRGQESIFKRTALRVLDVNGLTPEVAQDAIVSAFTKAGEMISS